MNRLLRLFSVFALLLISSAAYAQGGGIKGVLKDEKGNPITSAGVQVFSGGILKGGVATDFDGEYSIGSLDAGRYDVKFSYQGNDITIQGVLVLASQIQTVNATLSTSKVLGGVEKHAVRSFKRPIVDLEKPGGLTIKSGTEIENAPTRNTSDIAGLSTQAYQSSSGAGIGFGGGRPGSSTKYIIDGQELATGSSAFTNLPPNSVEAIASYSSGVPAKYGDASGGLISLTTKGATARHQGNIQYEHSFEGYNQNQLTLNLSGPVFRRFDSSIGGKRSILGYSFTADGIFADDYNPVYDKTWYVKDSRLAELQAHPLIPVQTQGLTQPEYAAQYIHDTDLEQRRVRPNSKYYRGNVSGKLDFNLTNNISVRVGASYFANNIPDYSRGGSLFSADNFERSNSQTGRGYLRFTQKFDTKESAAGTKDNTISDASYTVQADYQQDYTTNQDKNKKHNTFDYGYVGKFDELYVPTYTPGDVDPTTGKVGVRLTGYAPAGVIFTPGTQNPLLANYTKDYYAYNPTPVLQAQIQAGRGLRNGDDPASIYGLFTNIGTIGADATGTRLNGGWSKSNGDQVGVTVDAAFKYKHKKTEHSIQFGLYYQQQTRRAYSVSGSAIWGLMRQLSQRVVPPNEVDTRYAKFIINGDTVDYTQVLNGSRTPGPNDTIIYARKFDSAAQSAFDRHLREKLYSLGEISSRRDYINTDKYAPSMYSLDLFSADDLLNSGTSAVSYYGYDYTGKQVNGQVNFNDFWTKKDAEGYYTRPIGAYRPNYIAGYLSDYITYKDFRLTLGVRIERFDNNTKVLKDPYSLSATRTAGDIHASDRPANIGDNFVAYVGDNNGANPKVIGYRDGDTWYDAQGREVEDPLVLKTGSGASGLEPYLQNATVKIRDTGFDPNTIFTDYKPVVNAMPRINFSFPLTEKAIFYAHYDIMYQRPAGAYATPTDYFFLAQNPTRIYNNSNLKPERAIDYEIGFLQQLTDESGLTISGFYKERKDQIQVRRYLYAYPISYLAYGNRDFSTYKGLSLAYELRRLASTPLSMTVNYTLSFTSGTGSGPTSSNAILTQLIASGLPNLRPQFPLAYDSRHNINAQIDYRYGPEEGPTVGGRHIFQNAGAQLIFRAHSGEPYTKYQFAQSLQTGANNSAVIAGTVNGSRLPWHYGFDLNVNKTVALRYKTITLDDKDKTQKRVPTRMSLNIYAYTRNLFNIREILSVYGYTGRADDDAYLTSPQGLTVSEGQADPSTFKTLYSILANDPANYGNPRLFFVGAAFNF